MDRSHLAAAAVLLTAAAAAGAWYVRSAPEPPPVALVAAASPSAAAEAALTVHVSGAVSGPGLIEIPEGARVADAIAAAGGALPGADLTALNLAAQVADGQQLVVPSSSAAGGSASGGGSTGDGKVRVNTAAAEELERLPGVGPVLAGRILDHRDAYGPFGTVEDLLDVPGIGEGKLAALRDAVQVP